MNIVVPLYFRNSLRIPDDGVASRGGTVVEIGVGIEGFANLDVQIIYSRVATRPQTEFEGVETVHIGVKVGHPHVPMDDDSIVKYGHSTRVEEDTIRQYKWTDEKLDSDAFLYQNVINFKRSANPRGHAHHCVMCGDKRAAIPSQNKDVCKTCDSAYWLVENIQILVKFCKGKSLF